MRVLLVDNYDSFVYNLAQYIGKYAEVEVIRCNDNMEFSEYDRIVISPGPGHPRDYAGVLGMIKKHSPSIPTLGICLGHQMICHAFGGKVVGAERILHGKTSRIFHDGMGVYRNIPNPFLATRYHSLVASSLPSKLLVTSKSEEEEIMGIRHKEYPIEGLQFHPESILTKEGERMIKNFLEVNE